MPDLDIYVWGKQVLNDFDIDLTNLPSNIIMMGSYKSIDDIPLAGFDFLLYTAEWDGLPTVLIEVACRGIPVVASNVGGIGDLIDSTTGWPIDDFLNADEYVNAIESMYQSGQMCERANKLRNRSIEVCKKEKFTQNIIESLG